MELFTVNKNIKIIKELKESRKCDEAVNLVFVNVAPGTGFGSNGNRIEFCGQKAKYPNSILSD